MPCPPHPLPRYGTEQLAKRLVRSAFIGWCSSFVSDCCSNSIRVIKTAKQTATVSVTYREVVSGILAKEGVQGLMFRGLGTKLITNGIQGILFSVLWRMGQVGDLGGYLGGREMGTRTGLWGVWE